MQTGPHVTHVAQLSHFLERSNGGCFAMSDVTDLCPVERRVERQCTFLPAP